jgi:hypothetical protein
VGKLKKPSALLNWVLLLEQMRSFVGGFDREQVKEDPVCFCNLFHQLTDMMCRRKQVGPSLLLYMSLTSHLHRQ